MKLTQADRTALEQSKKDATRAWLRVGRVLGPRRDLGQMSDTDYAKIRYHLISARDSIGEILLPSSPTDGDTAEQ